MDDGCTEFAAVLVASIDYELDFHMVGVVVSHMPPGAAVSAVSVAIVHPGAPVFGNRGMSWIGYVQHPCFLPVKWHTVRAAMLELLLMEMRRFPAWYSYSGAQTSDHFAYSSNVACERVGAQLGEESHVLQSDLRHTWSQGVLLGPGGSKILPVSLREVAEPHDSRAVFVV